MTSVKAMRDYENLKERLGEELGQALYDAVALVDKMHPRTRKLIENDVPFMVVCCDEPYAWKVAALIKEKEDADGSWTPECQAWMEEQGLDV